MMAGEPPVPKAAPGSDDEPPVPVFKGVGPRHWEPELWIHSAITFSAS